MRILRNRFMRIIAFWQQYKLFKIFFQLMFRVKQTEKRFDRFTFGM